MIDGMEWAYQLLNQQPGAQPDAGAALSQPPPEMSAEPSSPAGGAAAASGLQGHQPQSPFAGYMDRVKNEMRKPDYQKHMAQSLQGGIRSAMGQDGQRQGGPPPSQPSGPRVQGQQGGGDAMSFMAGRGRQASPFDFDGRQGGDLRRRRPIFGA